MKFQFRYCQVNDSENSTVKPRFTVFVAGPEKERWIRENDKCGALYKIGFVQGPQKFTDGSWKTINPGMNDLGFTVFKNKSYNFSTI
jgi:hypothetical protein